MFFDGLIKYINRLSFFHHLFLSQHFSGKLDVENVSLPSVNDEV